MLTKIYIPVIDTESGEYKYEGNLSREAYESMVLDNFLATNNEMNRFAYNLAHGISNIDDRRVNRNSGNQGTGPEIKYDFYEAEAFIQNSKREDVDSDFFKEHSSKGDMFLLLINVNPNSIDGDSESELRFWIGDSLKIHKDPTLDDKTRLETLPKRSLKIKIDDSDEKLGILKNCKILQDFSDKKYPFKFAIIVEKIIY